MYTENTKVSELTVKELREILKAEIALMLPNRTFYDYSKVYVATKTGIEHKPIYPNPLSEPYCQGTSGM